MSAVRNVTERITSTVPSIRSGSEPESEPQPDAFACRNCGRTIDADVERCPNCSSANLRPLFF